MKPPVLLRIYLNGELKDVKQFAEGQIVIGQSSEVQLPLSEEGVSHLHAMIEERNQVYYLSDLGSESGTFKNGKKILEVQLQSGDELVVGPYNIQFSVGVPRSVSSTGARVAPTAAPHPPKVSQKPRTAVKQKEPIIKPEGLVIKREETVVEPPEPKVQQEETVVKPPAPKVQQEETAVEPPEPKVQQEESIVKPPEPEVQQEETVVKPPEPKVQQEESIVKPPEPEVQQEETVVKPPEPEVQQEKTVVKPPEPEVQQEKTVVRPSEPEAQQVMTPKVDSTSPSTPQSDIQQDFESLPLPSERAMGVSDEGAATDLKDLKPGSGSVVEVLVAWKDRVISTHHFDQKGTVTIGSDDDNDIVVPLLGVSKTKHNLLKIESLASICITNEMSGQRMTESGDTKSFSELMRSGGMKKVRGGYKIQLNQGEMAQVGFQGETVSVYVRYVGATPKPLVAPLLDLTTSEVTAVILAMVISAILGLSMLVYTPVPINDQALLEETLHRKAKITFKVPKRKNEIAPKPKKKKKKKLVRVPEKIKKKKVKKKKASTVSKGNPGKAAAVKPKKTKSKKKKLTSAKSGGAIKTGKKAANAKSKKQDPTKLGLLSVFGSKGTQSKLSKVYSGSGELIGTADSATGKAGQEVNRAGENLGSKIKGDAAGGKGSASVGISGVGTKGRGTGDFGYGNGALGKKGNVSISLGGQEASFTGSIDKEAIRRVIRANRRTIRNCYERELRANSNLHGKITLRWIIVERGRVSTASVKNNSMGNKNVANCIINRLKTWTFPEPPSDQQAEVIYPFVFSSQ